jgi:signal transduction histidine kinase
VNLIDNAVKFSPSGGRIDVELEQVELDTIRFAVRDHGIGVPEEHRSQLFTRFYQAHGREHRSGMGLGLYICREIAEMHDGTIRAEFPNDGGTRVVLEIPAGSHGSADGSTEQPIGTAEAVASQQPSTG